MALAGEPADEKDLIHYTKELEDEADSMAMSLVAMAGFDPNNVFVYLNNHIDDDQGFYVKQHPITEKRVEYISTLLDNSVKLRDRAFKNGVHPQCSNIQ
jgi:predicted Zn-dependent protease